MSIKFIFLFWHFWSFSIYFNLFSIKVGGFWTFQSFFELLESISSWWLGFILWIQIKKVDLKAIWSQYQTKFGSRSIRSPKLTAKPNLNSTEAGVNFIKQQNPNFNFIHKFWCFKHQNQCLKYQFWSVKHQNFNTKKVAVLTPKW